MFTSAIYRARRAELAKAVGQGLLLLPANGEAPMNYADNIYPFRQDSTFRYFTGLNLPDLVLLIDADTGHSFLYGEDFSIDHIIWMGQQPSVAHLAEQAGIREYGDLQALRQRLASSTQPVYFLPPYRAERREQLLGWLGGRADFQQAYKEGGAPAQAGTQYGHTSAGAMPMDVAVFFKMLTQRPGNLQLIRSVIQQRAIKSAEEIAEMEIAVNTTRAMHHRAIEIAAAGMTEAEVAGELEGIAIAAGGRLSYPAIVTRNGHILHNHYHGNILRKGDLLLIDAGAESASGYAGDITRTLCVGSSRSQQQEEIYQIVKKAEEDVIRDLRPGIPYAHYHQQAALIIAEGLRGLGLMKGDPKEAVAAGAHALFFPHGLGHMIGLDVHDMEDLGEDLVGYDDEIQRSSQFGTRSLRLGRRLEAGFVLTVEPGIYFIPALMDLWQQEGRYSDFINYPALAAYRDFGGIRLEDNVLITATGSRVLGEPIEK